MTKLTKINVDWKHVKNACRTTVNKKESNKDASNKFKLDLLISEHSPIRRIQVSWLWEDLKSWVATHFSRHKWECYISTQRTDRTGINRDELPQGEQVRFEGEANAQQLIDTARKRLCYCSSKETREKFESLKVSLANEVDTQELAEVLVPNCVYRGGCPECFSKCEFYTNFLLHTIDDCELDLTNIKERYRAYNDIFYSKVISNA